MSKGIRVPRDALKLFIKNIKSASGDLINIDFSRREQKIKKQLPFSFSAK